MKSLSQVLFLGLGILSGCILNSPAKAQPFVEQTNITLTGVAYSSVAWGDYDNDGYMDILLSGALRSGRVTKIYRNNGNNSFTEQTTINLPGLKYSGVSWGDYDNDGYLDILVTGETTSGNISKIFHNNGDNTFTELAGVSLIGLNNGKAAWGDCDNDGDIDIFIAGESGYSYLSKLYINNGHGTFNEKLGNISSRGLAFGSCMWVDYDNDEDLDIIVMDEQYTYFLENEGDYNFKDFQFQHEYFDISGAIGDYNSDGFIDFVVNGNNYNDNQTYRTEVFKNDKSGSFEFQSSIILPGVDYGSVSWGDYDNDGDLDLLLTGLTKSNGLIAKIFTNNGNNTFSELAGTLLTGVEYGSTAWCDYDNDGDLDILITGYTGSDYISKIYRNDIVSTKNTVPSMPTGLISMVRNDSVTLRWIKSADSKTASAGLTYNLSIGTAPSGFDVVSPLSDINTGYHRVPLMGNGQLDTIYQLKNLKKGTYYWSVQAIDNNFAGSNFSPEQQFTIGANRQAYMLQISNTASSSVFLNWYRGNLDSCIVFVKEGLGEDYAMPLNNTSYSAGDFAIGSEIGNSGWFCVYNGYNPSLTVKGLKANTVYRVCVYEYEGNKGSEKYFISTNSGNALQFKTKLFAVETAATIPGSYEESGEWADYDNDGDLDVLIIGKDISRIFRNDGNGKFTYQSGIALPAVDYGSAAWGDYDNDGYPDILITGLSSVGRIARIYRNNGNNTFTLQSGINLQGVSLSAVAWGDYDNDGDLDILITGSISSYNRISQIYSNDGNNTFTAKTAISLKAIYEGSVAWGDYDNDGDLDILLSGYSTTGPISTIYRNNGNNSFSEISGLSLAPVYNSSVDWGDYDNDGDLDILLSGNSGSTGNSKIYRNNGNGSFTEQTGISLAGRTVGSSGWADYDNDGDLDIIIFDGSKIYYYQNNSDNTFSLQDNISIDGISGYTFATADFDNDNDLDLLIFGSSSTVLYRNEIYSTSNTLPFVPINLTSDVKGSHVTLNWAAAHDNETPSDGLSYNVKIKPALSDDYVVSPMSEDYFGYRLVINSGNAQENLSYKIESLKKGTYSWSVQAIDNCFAGGDWAPVATFTVEADTIMVSSDTIYVAAAANSKASFNLSSNVNWKVSCADDWFNTSDTAGFGNQKILLTADAYTSDVPRIGKIIISSNEADTVSVTLIQSIDYVSSNHENLKYNSNVYPNPVSDELHMDGLEGKQIRLVTLYGSVIEQKRLASNSEIIHLSNLQEGIYLLQIEGKTIKVVKQ